jgi:NAD(P)-dependent dehydrogenase (short-subunit alcohol dehydrogenase family)
MADTDRDLSGKRVIITGATSGIGRVTAERLAARGATLVLACRSEERTRPVLEEIRSKGGEASFVPLDLGDLASVRGCAEQIMAVDRPIHVLINNAGLAGQRGTTKDGFETAFGTNHLGHFLLTVLLAKGLRAEAPSRIVNVASTAHYRARGIDFDAVCHTTRTLTGFPEYAVSKLANVLFTRELARRLGPSGVHSYAIHPGVVASDVWRSVPWPVGSFIKLFMISNEEGAQTTLYCATSPEVAGHEGRYYDACREREPSKVAQDPELSRALWDWSAQKVGADL